MGRLGWSERQALSADINSVVGALNERGREMMEIFYPQVAAKMERDESRKRRSIADRWDTWETEHNATVAARAKQKRRGRTQ